MCFIVFVPLRELYFNMIYSSQYTTLHFHISPYQNNPVLLIFLSFRLVATCNAVCIKKWMVHYFSGCASGQEVLWHGSRNQCRRPRPRHPGPDQTRLVVWFRCIQQRGKCSYLSYLKVVKCINREYWLSGTIQRYLNASIVLEQRVCLNCLDKSFTQHPALNVPILKSILRCIYRIFVSLDCYFWGGL